MHCVCYLSQIILNEIITCFRKHLSVSLQIPPGIFEAVLVFSSGSWLVPSMSLSTLHIFFLNDF